MRTQRVNPVLRTSLDSSTIFGILLALIWMRYTVVAYVLQIISMLPIVNVASTIVFPAAVILLTLIILPWMAKRVRVEALILYMVAAIVILLSTILFPENGDIVTEKLPRILTAVLPMVFIGVCYDHQRHKGILFWSSVISVVTMLAYQIYKLSKGEELMEDNMDAAYKTLPSIMFLIYYAFEKKKFRYTLLAVLAGIAAFVFGTRGPILCIAAFTAILIFQIMKTRKSNGMKILLFAIVVGLACLLIFGDVLTTLAESLSEQFAKWGFSTRVFDYFIEGDFSETNGRSIIFEIVTAAINERPIVGHGFLGDQMLIGQGDAGAYAHNLFLELWCQFGLIIGSFILLYFIGKPILALVRQKGRTDMQNFLWMLICMNFVKLMLSSTYTDEQYFFFMIGVSIAATHSAGLRAVAQEQLEE